MNYQDFLSNNSNINSNVIYNVNYSSNYENQKLRDELNRYKKENEELKNKINLLSNENMKLKNELTKANKIISNLNSNNQQNNNVNNLNEIIRNKDIEINNLKLQLQNNDNKKPTFKFDDIIAVHFISTDQRINYPITCLKTDTFAQVEEKLYQKYEEYREKNNNFIAEGRLILRFKKICENQIEDGDKIQLLVE